MAIQRKRGANIVAKEFVNYSELTFDSVVAETDNKFGTMQLEVSAEEALDRIKPATFDFLPGKRVLFTDTETYYTGVPSNRMPENVVRRWIKGNGSKYIPNDFPFCISMCDGINSYVVYDTLQNKFAEFHKLAPLLSDRSIDKCFHNGNFDKHMLANTGTDLRGYIHETLHASKICRADAFTHKLLDIAKECGGITTYELMLDALKAQYHVTDYRRFPHNLMTHYTGADTYNDYIVFKTLMPTVMSDPRALNLYDIECNVSQIAYTMERGGVKIAAAYKDILIPELEKERDDAEREIYDTAGYMFNINSGQQVYDALDHLGYAGHVKFKKDTGNPILDKIEMERLENEGVPLVEKIQAFKASEKLLNTFAIKLYDMCDAKDIVHCNFNTNEAKTGRFSISAPSMQNMPRRKDSRVRGAFIPQEGYTLYDFDFKSQESLILAHYSRAPYLLNIINSGGDIHTAVAAIIYSKEYKDVSKALRGIAKSVEFAIVYGAGAQKVHVMTGLTIEEADMAMKTFLRNVPEVQIFIKTANNTVKQQGFIRTRLGRQVFTERGREYACVNYVIQGSAADSTKTRIIDIYKFLKANGYKSRPIIQVHDSLLNKIYDAEVEQGILGKLRWLQTERKLFRVTVTVDVAKCNGSWREKEDIDVPEIEPTPEEMERMQNYDIWDEGLFNI